MNEFPTGLKTRDKIEQCLYLAENVYHGYLARQKLFEALALSESFEEPERDVKVLLIWQVAERLGFEDLKGPVIRLCSRSSPC